MRTKSVNKNLALLLAGLLIAGGVQQPVFAKRTDEKELQNLHILKQNEQGEPEQTQNSDDGNPAADPGTNDPAQPDQNPDNPSDEPVKIGETSVIDTLVLVDGQVVDSIDEKQDAEIQVVLNNKTVKTSQVTDSKPGPDPENISIDRLSDGFRGGDHPEIILESAPDQKLTLKVNFKNVRWRGKDDLFSFQLNLGDTTQKIEIHIREVNLSKPEEPVPDDNPGAGEIPDFGGDYGGGSYGGGTSDPVKINSATPNLIVSQYSFGGDNVKAGSKFELTLTFGNTSKNLNVENVVMSIEPEGGLSIADGSNTFYFDSLGPKAEKTLKINMNSTTPENGASPAINIAFRYEYVDNDQRMEKTSSEKIVIPVIQKDRMEITEPSITEPAYIGQEFVLSFPYVNKGKGTLYNVALKAEGEGFSTLVPVQNLGNFESGKSGSMDFVIIPEQPGELKLKVVITYENADEKEIKKEYPVTLMVQEMMVPETPVVPEQQVEQSSSKTPWIIAAAAVILGGLGFFFYRKKKKKAANQSLSSNQDLESYFDDSAKKDE